MRKALLISASVIVVVIAGLLIYAFVNLNSIIDSNRTLILSRLSTSLDRPVTIGGIKASLGWGIAIEVDGLRIADDPAFSQEPFVAANQVAIDVEFLPLLHGKAKLKRLNLIEPQIHLIRNTAGVLNVSTIGGRGGGQSSAGRSPIAALYVKSLAIENATVIYEDLAEPDAKPIKLHQIDLEVTNLSGIRPFEIELKLAILSHDQNVDVNGKVGPLLQAAILNTNAIPVDLKATVNSISLDRLRKLADVGSRIPPQLSISAPFNVSASITGTPNDLAFTANADLTPQEVRWADLFRKPERTVLAFDAAGGRSAGAITVSKAELRLASLKANASDVSIGGSAPPGAKIETNEFNLADVAPMFPAAARYDVAGTAKVVADVHLVNGKPDGVGTIALQKVALRSGGGIPPVSDLTGKVTIDHGRIRIEPTTFTVASSRASIDATTDSIEPLDAGYGLSIDSLHPSVFMKGRPSDEVINNLIIRGTAQGNPRAPAIQAHIQSTDGLFAAVRYSNLDVTAAYADGRVSARPFRADVFKGSVVANANATLGERPRFGVGLNLNNIDVEQALRSQKISAANWVHGRLTGNVTATGSGRKWPEIQPTLSGNGAMSLTNGELVGVNIVALAINGITSVPGVSQVVNATFMSNHSGLLADPNTELNNASMTFVLSGRRITTHDLTVQSPDYGITGDGWFDMNKNIDMDSDIKLTVGLSFAIPVWVKGKLPAVIVLPNVPKLTERLALGAISAPGRIIRGGVSAVGSIFGGGSSSGSSNGSGSSGSSSGSSSPFKAFKSLLP